MTRLRVARARRFADLATYLARTGESQARVAARCGTTQAHVSRIASGQVVPRAALASRLVRACRIPLESFTRVYLAKREVRSA